MAWNDPPNIIQQNSQAKKSKHRYVPPILGHSQPQFIDNSITSYQGLVTSNPTISTQPMPPITAQPAVYQPQPPMYQPQQNMYQPQQSTETRLNNK